MIITTLLVFGTAIILYEALKQSRKGNELQSSLLFYNEECDKIDKLLTGWLRNLIWDESNLKIRIYALYLFS